MVPLCRCVSDLGSVGPLGDAVHGEWGLYGCVADLGFMGGRAAHKGSVMNPDESNELPVRPSERKLPPLYWMVGRLTGGAVFTSTDPDVLLRALIPGYTVAYGMDGAANTQQRQERVNAVYRVATTAQGAIIAKLRATGAFRRLPAAVRAELLRNKTEAAGLIVEVWESEWPLLLLNDEVVPARLRRRKHPSVTVLNGRTDRSFLESLRSVGLISKWGVLEDPSRDHLGVDDRDVR